MNTIINTDITQAARLLAAGEIVAIPTETVYGLAANALNPAAINKIFEAKGRPRDNPLIVHVSDMEMVHGLGLEVSGLAEKLTKKFWAGSLTIVLKKIKDIIPAEVSCRLDTVAVRTPAHPVAMELIKICGFPLAAPSANISGSPSPTRAEHVMADMNGKIPLILDGGRCDVGVESTVVMLDGDKIRVLRPGAVTPEMLAKFGEVVIDDNGSLHSPGTRHKHYSPRAEVIAVEGDVTGMGGYIINDPSPQTLYAMLREFDEAGAEKIFIRLPRPDGIGLALYNRIVRAAEFKIIKVE